MPNLNAVADSTVLVSAFISKGGVSAVLLREAAGGVFELSLSQEIITETQTVLVEREHLRERYPYTNEDVTEFCQFLQRSFPLVTELPPLTGIVRDPNDDIIIATAHGAQAAYLITRDNDLLALQRYEEITIITPEAFMALVRACRRDTSTGEESTPP
jgi:uncharacterized protein